MARKINKDARYQPINTAADITGLSRKYIRQGCIEKTIPHIRVGRDYRIDMELFYEQLTKESLEGCTNE